MPGHSAAAVIARIRYPVFLESVAVRPAELRLLGVIVCSMPDGNGKIFQIRLFYDYGKGEFGNALFVTAPIISGVREGNGDRIRTRLGKADFSRLFRSRLHDLHAAIDLTAVELFSRNGNFHDRGVKLITDVVEVERMRFARCRIISGHIVLIGQPACRFAGAIGRSVRI